MIDYHINDNFNNISVHSQNSSQSSIEFFMTSEQQHVISELLPKGYSLQFASKPVRQKSGSFNKGASLVRQNSQQLDGQLRNSNGQFAASTIKSMKPTKYCNGQLSAQDNLSMQSSYNNMNPAYPQQYSQNDEQDYYGNEYAGYDPNIASDLSLQSRKSNISKRRDKRGSDRSQKAKSKNNNSFGGKGGKNGQMQGGNNTGMLQEDMSKCLSILHSLQRHKSASPFLWPVDPVQQGCADYFMVIRDPMDLSTIEKNLRTNQYHSSTQFAADIRKIWNNSYLYNPKESQIYHMTLEMDKYFEKKYKEMESQVHQSVMDIPYYYVRMLAQAIKDQHPIPPQRNSRIAPPSKKAKSVASKMDLPMTMQEKKFLGQNIMNLPPDCLRGIWEIVSADVNQQYDDKVLQFDIDTLSVRKTRELEQYVKQKTAGLNRRLTKKQNKIDDKSTSADNKLMQQAFGQDDETAATHQDSIHQQDYYNSDITQTTIAQSYQMPLNPTQQYQQDQYQTQTIGSNDTSIAKEQANRKHSANIYPRQEVAVGVEGGAGVLRPMPDNDSDSSFMSEDSESQNY